MRLIAVTLLIIYAVPAIAVEVYRSVDAAGNVVYSDRPQANNGQAAKLTIRTSAGSTNPPPSPPSPPSPLVDPAPADNDSESVPTTAEQRAANCATARERNARYETARRLYRELPTGERDYLDDSEIDAAKAKALADVAEWCN